MKRLGFVGLAILAVLLVVYGVLAGLSRPEPDHPFFALDRPLVIAHQGGAGLWPSNTMLAFEQAIALGVDVLELDIHSTADGVLVVMHDATVDRTTDGFGRIHDYTLAQLQQLDAAYDWPYEGESRPYRGQGVIVPTLESLLLAFPQMRLNIEIKQAVPSIVQPFCQMLRTYEMTGRVLVASFHPDTMLEFRQACPEVATSATESEIRPFFMLNTARLGAIYQAPAGAFQVPEYSGNLHVVTPHFVAGAHAHNVQVHVWTVNEADDMRHLLEQGIDGIITDFPDRLLAILNE